MGTHVLNLKLQLLLRPVGSALFKNGHGQLGVAVFSSDDAGGAQRSSTLKARCSRKWAVPLVSSVSAREPASIHMPTVEVWA